jgi:hypothetical protein
MPRRVHSAGKANIALRLVFPANGMNAPLHRPDPILRFELPQIGKPDPSYLLPAAILDVASPAVVLVDYQDASGHDAPTLKAIRIREKLYGRDEG